MAWQALQSGPHCASTPRQRIKATAYQSVLISPFSPPGLFLPRPCRRQWHCSNYRGPRFSFHPLQNKLLEIAQNSFWSRRQRDLTNPFLGINFPLTSAKARGANLRADSTKRITDQGIESGSRGVHRTPQVEKPNRKNRWWLRAPRKESLRTGQAVTLPARNPSLIRGTAQ